MMSNIDLPFCVPQFLRSKTCKDSKISPLSVQTAFMHNFQTFSLEYIKI